MTLGEPDIKSNEEDQKLKQTDDSYRKPHSLVSKYGCLVVTIASAIGSAFFFYRMQRDREITHEPIYISVTTITQSGRAFMFIANWIFLLAFTFLNVQTIINLWNHLLREMDNTRDDLLINLKLLGFLGLMLGFWGSTILFNVLNFWKRMRHDPSQYCNQILTTASGSCGFFEYIVSPVPVTLAVIIGMSRMAMAILDQITGNDRFFKLPIFT